MRLPRVGNFLRLRRCMIQLLRMAAEGGAMRTGRGRMELVVVAQDMSAGTQRLVVVDVPSMEIKVMMPVTQAIKCGIILQLELAVLEEVAERGGLGSEEWIQTNRSVAAWGVMECHLTSQEQSFITVLGVGQGILGGEKRMVQMVMEVHPTTQARVEGPLNGTSRHVQVS